MLTRKHWRWTMALGGYEDAIDTTGNAIRCNAQQARGMKPA